MEETRIIHGDARSIPLPDESVDLLITSPPYFSLRSYRDEGEHYQGQLGSEATPQEFLEALWECTREWIRLLKPTGSLWVNLGDKYAGSGGHNNAGISNHGIGSSTLYGAGKPDIERRKELRDAIRAQRRNAPDRYNQNAGGIPAKSLMMLPARYAIGCVDRLGLILRAEVIWSKPNGLPESVTDRVRRSHEVFMHFTKSPRYFSAVDELREAHTVAPHAPGNLHADRARSSDDRMAEVWGNPLGKLPGSVWTIPTEPLVIPEALGLPDHFAAFPTEWPRRIILGWSPSGVCVECGEGRRPVVEPTAEYAQHLHGPGQSKQGIAENGLELGHRTMAHRPVIQSDYRVVGYACACPEPTAPTTPARVLDPFCGTGTTILVARSLGRIGIGVDLSKDYVRLANWRVFHSGHGAKAERRTWAERQLGLL